MKSALSFGLRDYSVSAYAPSALIEEISRDLSPWSFVFTERLIVLLLRQPRASPSVFFPMDHPSQYRVVVCVLEQLKFSGKASFLKDQSNKLLLR